MNFRRSHPYKSAATSQPLAKIGLEGLHSRIVAELRLYGCAHIADAVLRSLNVQQIASDELQSAPWLALLIVKWALQDPSVPMRLGKPMPQDRLDALKVILWNAPIESEPNVFLLFRSHFHVQYQWQREDDPMGFARWPALIALQHPNSLIRRQFKQAMGMDPTDYIDLTFAMAGGVLNRKGPLSPRWLDALRTHYPTQIDVLLKLFARPLANLREIVCASEAQKIRGRAELLEFPYFKRFPLLSRKDGLHVWHSKVFKQGLEDAVDMRMSTKFADDYVKSFSRVFEKYVVNLSLTASTSALTEREFWKEFGKDQRAVEVVIPGRVGNVLIEAKMSLYADEILLTDNEIVARQKSYRFREAFEKGLAVGRTLRSRPFAGGVFDKAEDYLIIVTSRDFLIRDAKMLSELYPDSWDPFRGDEKAARRLPMSNAIILSIGDFEMLLGIIKKNGLELSSVLHDASRANRNPETAKMLFLQHLEGMQRQRSALVSRALEESLDRIAVALKQPRDAFFSPSQE
jgi:hypothetical protein